MSWEHPSEAILADTVRGSAGRLLLSSPFVGRRALDIVAENLPDTVEAVEIWTRLSLRDWITGASDHEALVDFIDEIDRVADVTLFSAERLHTKLIVSDHGGMALAGSANLTAGGFVTNIELVRRVGGQEKAELLSYAQQIRPLLAGISRGELNEFLEGCLHRLPDRLAMQGLITELPSASAIGLLTIQVLEDYCRRYPAHLTDLVLRTSTGADETNRTGHVHQAFFTVQRFFQAHPEFLQQVAMASLDSEFDLESILGLLPAWIVFMNAHANESSEAPFAYSFSSMIRNLPAALGGTREGGGGWSAPFRRIWPVTARILTAA